MAEAVVSILDIELSSLQLLLWVSLIFIIGFGVPGIRGESLPSGGPIVMSLNIPAPISQSFLTLYLSLQIGLPDFFRTGSNSTDDYVCSIIIDDIYKKRFLGEKIGSKNHKDT